MLQFFHSVMSKKSEYCLLNQLNVCVMEAYLAVNSIYADVRVNTHERKLIKVAREPRSFQCFSLQSHAVANFPKISFPLKMNPFHTNYNISVEQNCSCAVSLINFYSNVKLQSNRRMGITNWILL
jgi:hypothetical protein